MEVKKLIAIPLTEIENNDDRKDELYEELILLNIQQNIDSKSSKKLFKLCHCLLKYKGEQVTSLLSELDILATKQGELEAGANLDNGNLTQEILKLKKTIEKLENEKLQSKTKIKELNEEIIFLQRKQEKNYESDRDDSPDVLSDIDRQQELLSNISSKNKHIKRLLVDIERLEKQNADLSTLLSDVKTDFNQSTHDLTATTSQLTEFNMEIKKQKTIITQQNAHISSLTVEVQEQHDNQIKREKEVEEFMEQLEERANLWKSVLDEKQNEIKILQEKFNQMHQNYSDFGTESERKEINHLHKMIKDRDDVIQKLENKIFYISKEMLSSSNKMNKLSEVKENSKKNRDENANNCGDSMKKLLDQSNERCRELQDILTNIEEDNILKSKQALEAIQTLRSYQSGEDGLPQALKKINELQYKVNSRDKQIRALIMEVNKSNDLSLENVALREKLGIADDDFISTKSITAKYRSIKKTNDRLIIKLRASEEMRLQLKLEKNDLKRQLFSLNIKNPKSTSIEHDSKGETVCDPYNIGSDSLNSINILDNKYLNRSNFNLSDELNFNTINEMEQKYKENIKSIEENYKIVVDENENLRIGMHEILQKIREYDAKSSHITIDSTTLEKLLHALDARSISGWYHPAMRMQNELLVTKEREIALRQRINDDATISKIKKKINPLCTAITNVVEEDQINDEYFVGDNQQTEAINEIKDPIIEDNRLENDLKELRNQIDKLENEVEELNVMKVQYNTLTASVNSSENEKTKQILNLSNEITNLNIELIKKNRKIDFLIIEHDMERQKNIKLNKDLIEIKSDYRNKHLKVMNEICEYKSTIQVYKENNKISTDKLKEQLEIENFKIKSNLAQLTQIFFTDFDQTQITLELSLKPTNFTQNIEIINENFINEYLTKNEFLELKQNLNDSSNKIEKLNTEIKKYEDLLNIADEQISIQQAMITKYSDEEISLYHLIADLQSSTNEKYLITKTQRELEYYKNLEQQMNRKIKDCEKEIGELNEKYLAMQFKKEKEIREQEANNQNNLLKVKYLTKLLLDLQEKYSNFAPLYPLCDIIKLYSKIVELRNDLAKKSIKHINENDKLIYENFYKDLRDEFLAKNDNCIETRIEIVKYQGKCEKLATELNQNEAKIVNLQLEIDELKIREMENQQLLSIIDVLFKGNDKPDLIHKEVQITIEKSNKSTSIENIAMKSYDTEIEVIQKSPLRKVLAPDSHQNINEILSKKSLELQLKKALTLASTRNAMILETENNLSEAQGKIKAIEKELEEKERLFREFKETKEREDFGNPKDDNILSKTISSLQKLLLEKDTTLMRYQDLLKNERQDQLKIFEESQKEIKILKENISELEKKLIEKSKYVTQLENEKNKTIYERQDDKRIMNENQETAASNELLMEISDKYIENLFMNEKSELEFEAKKIEIISMEKKLEESEDEIKRLQIQLRDVSNREKIWERNLCEKDKEIILLNQKLNNKNQFDIHLDRPVNAALPINKIEQLKEMLEEKDKHIQDLTDTLTHFHDDQQKFIVDTSLHSAEQVSQLSADLNRQEATNRVLNTQIEAFKRQISNLSQREKQARETVKTLKNQLIRRPIVSVKADRPINSREEHLQRKLEQLKSELLETKDDLTRQTGLAETRRTKNASELDLWNKQKHWQQASEKLKTKLKERESELEKIKSNLTIAKTSIARLEREKQILENRVRSSRYFTGVPMSSNLKYTISESPELYNKFCDCVSLGTHKDGSRKKLDYLDQHHEIMEALKSRIEWQQRKIIAMELEGRGSNALATELEKLQEKSSNLEAQNLRLEAKNLQLQLDNDILRQGDEGERMKHQIKHLEDYILVLKDELSQALSANAMQSHLPSKSVGGSTERMEQTILALRSIVERLKVENKNLKEAKRFAVSNKTIGNDIYDQHQNDYNKLQLHSDALNKISVQIHSGSNIKKSMMNHENGEIVDFVTELGNIKEKLKQKTQLLEKAKILLTRAAAKEKNLREQIEFWKRKCSVLENFPIIDETSEGDP